MPLNAKTIKRGCRFSLEAESTPSKNSKRKENSSWSLQESPAEKVE